MGTYNGAPNAGQLITILDNLAAIFDASYPGMGIGAGTESGTAASAALSLKTALLGDGNAIPGIGNVFASNHSAAADALYQRFRWDTAWAAAGRPFFTDLDSQIGSTVPSGWLLTGTTSLHALNSHLLRMNGCHTGVPTTPSAGTLTAVNNSAGLIPTCTLGNCPRVVHTLGGANEWDESLPCAQATQVAISGNNNALSYQIAGAVPAGVNWVKTYRGYVAGGVGIWFYDQKTTVTPLASSYPAIVLAQPDALLDTNWIPPSWLSCLIKPSTAMIMALAYAVSAASQLVPGVPIKLTDASMATPANVALGPSNAFIGAGNLAGSSYFGTTVIGTGYTAAQIQAVNSAASRLQGFAGAPKLQARITSVCNAAPTVNLTYSYLDAANGQTLQTGGTATATFSSAAVGTVVPIPITAGRLVKAVTADAPSGAASGTYIIEAAPAR